MWAATARRCTSCPIAAARRTSGPQPIRRRRGEGGHDVHRRPRAVADDLDGRQDDRVRARLRHLDRRHDQRRRRARCRSRCAARRRRPPSSIARSPIRFRSWRSRPTARRSRSPSAARCSRRRPRTAATPCGSRTPPARNRSWPGRPTAAGWSIVSTATARDHLFLYDFATGQETPLTSGAARDQLAALLARRQVDRVRARRPRAAGHRSGDEAGAAGRHRRSSTRRRSVDAARRSPGRRTRKFIA